jgi:hypothetical protein
MFNRLPPAQTVPGDHRHQQKGDHNMNVKKITMLAFAWALLIGSQSWASSGQSNMDQYAYLTQDSISLVGNDLELNGVTATIDEVQNRIKAAYSVHVGAYNPDFSQLMALLKIVKDSGIRDQLVILDLFSNKGCENEGVRHLFSTAKSEKESGLESVRLLTLETDGQLLLSDKPIELADLTELLSAEEIVAFHCIGSFQFSRVYEVLQTLDPSSISDFRLVVQGRQQLRVQAKVVEILDDETEKLLSSPLCTTKPGGMVSIGVKEMQSQTEEDIYQQNGGSGGGVSLKVLPQVIGCYIRVTGSISIKRVDRYEAFKLNDESILNYTAETTVIPFAYVFDKETDTIKSDPIDIGGKKYACYITAFHVSNQGEKISAIKQSPSR